MPTSRELRGLRQAVAGMRAIAREYATDRVAGALYRRAQGVMADSQENYVPVELGTLKNSGHVNLPVRSGRVVRVTMAYGGAARAYAIAIHEHPSKYSPRSWQGVAVRFAAGRGPKYLERPLFKAVATMPQDLAADLALARSGAA